MTHSVVDPLPRPNDASAAPISVKSPQRATRHWRTLALVLVAGAGVALALWWWRPYAFHGIVLQSPTRATDFTLTASTGAPMRLSDWRGKVVLLYFGYTACPDACPLTLADLTQTMQLLGKQADKVQVVLISV